MIYRLGLATLVVTTLFSTLNATQDMNKWLRPLEVPQPKDNLLTPERIELGKLLYFDTRLSSSGKISCATCHHPKRGWTDLIPVAKAVGHQGRVGPRNSPVILNSAYQNRQFWDGRVRTLEQQAVGPIETGVEMNMPLDKLLPTLNNIKGYQKLFKVAYPKSKGIITKDYLAKAIASFERTVVSTTSPFDRFIKGDSYAINQKAKEGFELFQGKAHCTDCHDGFNFTDGSFHNVGLGDDDIGRQQMKMKRKAWSHAFKTPTLRDIEKSGPYFHDGSVFTLQESVAICGNGGRYPNKYGTSSSIKNRNLNTNDIDKITQFLKTLTGPNLPIIVPTVFPN